MALELIEKMDPEFLNLKNHNGQTPLQLAQEAGHEKIVQALQKRVSS